MGNHLVSLLVLLHTLGVFALEQRSHSHGPEWMDHCWDQADNHIMDPFCALLNSVTCNGIPEVANANHTVPDNTQPGAVVSYTCNEAYSLTGNDTIECIEVDGDNGAKIGTWTTTPVCQTDALDCASCTNITSPSDCHNYIQCNTGDICFTESNGVGADTTYTSGCKSRYDCSVGSSPAPDCLQCCAQDICNKRLCAAGVIVGSWSVWSNWSACANGLRTRTRICNNPQPDLCSGSDEEIIRCGPVMFSVTYAKGKYRDGLPMLNFGMGYNQTTGNFTCPIAGVYEFVVYVKDNYDFQIKCWIEYNGQETNSTQGPPDDVVTSLNMQMTLSVGDTVRVGRCDNGFRSNFDVTFSGTLV